MTSKKPDGMTIKALRQALKDWASSPKLGQNPLAQLQIVIKRREKSKNPDTLEYRGQALRGVLREAINTFPRTPDTDDIPPRAERAYYILRQCFIEGYSWEYVAAQLGIARRTFYEEQAQALNTLLEILQTQEAVAQAIAKPSPDSLPPAPALGEIVENFAKLPLETIPAPSPLPRGSVMPLERNPLFVGREHDFKTLASALKGGATVAIGQIETAAATGVGGIGKTQLACEFVHRYGRFFGGGVFWLSFAEAKAVPAEIAACGGLGRMDLRPNFGELALEDQLNLVRAAWQEPVPRLLIFDNCEEPKLLQQWRPTSGGCRILVTSRRATWDSVLTVQSLPLDVLPRAESLSLLGEHCPEADIDVLKAIAEELGDLPLALHLAGSYMANYKRIITPALYLAQLQSPALLEHLSFEDVGPSPTQHVQNIYRTMALSYDRLNPDNPVDQLAQQILASAVCLAPGEPIPHDLLVATLHLPVGDLKTAVQAEDALKRLLALGLIILASDEAYRLHRLVVAFIQDAIPSYVAEAQGAVENALERQAALINQSGDPRPLLVWQAHLRLVTNTALERKDLQAASLCNELGWHLWHTGSYVDGRPYFERALEIRRRILGEEHPDTAHSYNSLGYLLRSQGKLDEAKPCFEQALTIRENILGIEHADTAVTLNDMGRLFEEQGDLETAKMHYERALAISKKVLGEEHPLTAEYLNNVGVCFRGLGDLESARQHYEQALIINKKVFGVDHPDTALNLNNIGYLLYISGALLEAKPYHEQALAIREKVLGPEHPETAQSLSNLGAVLQGLGELKQARNHLLRALDIRENVLGKKHPRTAICLDHLGQLLQELGNLDQAQQYLEQALDIRKEFLGREHPLTGQSFYNLGTILKTRGNITSARLYYKRALTIFEDQLGPHHPDTINLQDNLAILSTFA